MIELLKLESYNPNPLLDSLIEDLDLKSDASLAYVLGTGAPTLCRIRNRRAPITSNLLLAIHDIAGYDVDHARQLAGIPKVQKREPKKAQKPGRKSVREAVCLG